MLGEFQNDLGSISSEIRSLQEESVSINLKLKNRRDVSENLASFVGGMSISAEFVDTIFNAPLDEAFLEALLTLERKLDYVAGQPEEAASTIEVKADLDNLVTTAVARIREFILSKILAVRKPMTNIQIQQNALLKLKAAFVFVAKHSKPAAIEIRNEYAKPHISLLVFLGGPCVRLSSFPVTYRLFLCNLWRKVCGDLRESSFHLFQELPQPASQAPI